MLSYIILFLPLLAAVFPFVFGRVFSDKTVGYVNACAISVCAILSWLLFLFADMSEPTVVDNIFPWLKLGNYEIWWQIRNDRLTYVMFVVVNTVSSLVHFYSIGYMHKDDAQKKFYAFLSLFTFMMLALVSSNNMAQMFFGWEGVGLASYLLIGFWFKKESASSAAIKAFVVNRIADVGFAMGIFMIYFAVGSLDFDVIFSRLQNLSENKLLFLGSEFDIINVIALFLFIGAMGKSAQFLFHTWLPDAMEGPTPVSALIHAATMVTAGVFMIARMSPLFDLAPIIKNLIIIVGALTAFVAASIGLVQNDIKKVIAYSTCSQLGYMFVSLGLGAFNVAIFHLFTHAFFKALLFLSAGNVIYATHHEQDIRKMGNLKEYLPQTLLFFIAGTLSLTGFLFTSGYFSKDVIIEAAFAVNNFYGELAYWLIILAALMTSFYSWRLIFIVFFQKSRMDPDVVSHIHEPPLVMRAPCYVLLFLSIFSGYIFFNNFTGASMVDFWNEDIVVMPMDMIENIPGIVKWSPSIVMFLGFLLTVWFYLIDPKIPKKLASSQDALYAFLSSKYYFDEIYDFLFTRPYAWLCKMAFKLCDGKIINGLGPDGVAYVVSRVSKWQARFQSGLINDYALFMLLGLFAFLGLLFF